MPAAAADAPAVALSFANNFWGKEDAGVGPLLSRMGGAKQTCDELRTFYGARASIEEEYARKLLGICRKPLGSQETGTLKTSLDTLRAEVEQMAKQHQNNAAQMKSELEEPLAAFGGGMKERRKIVQNTVEKLLKTKTQQTQHVNKTRDKYEQECLKIKGYLAQGHMVMGQEERRNKAKLEKTQISLASSNTEYESAVKALEDTTARWNREWKAAADKFQDLEEERLDFMKSSLWTFANIASTVCVSDDASCEKIRLSLEKMDVEKDIITFITERGTGQEIPDAPKYINFCRGDINDSQSEASEDDNYSVAQFPRSINPAFRSSSPQPSTFESHHDPNSALAQDLRHHETGSAGRREFGSLKQNPEDLLPDPQQWMPQKQQRMIQQGQPTRGSIEQRRSMEQRRSVEDQNHRQAPQVQGGYDAKQHGPVSSVPHDPYPMDGMTMLCRTGPPGPPSDRSSQITSGRPSSADSHEHSDYSNPTSFTSQEPPSGKTSPVKQDPIPSPTKVVAKRKSGFLKNHSPFRRKSQKESQPQAQTNRNTWHAANLRNPGQPRRPQLYNQESAPIAAAERTQSPEPIDANASLALGVGQNVFSVSNTDNKKRAATSPAKEAEETDPIALALAELKGVTLGKQSSVRMSADHYHGIATPVPGSEASMSRSVPAPGSHDAAATKRGTPPPSYPAAHVSRLGVPPPAVTSKAMKEATKKVTSQTRSVFGEGDRAGSGGYNSSPLRGGNRGQAGESGGYSTAPISRSGAKAAEMSRGEHGGYNGTPMSRPGTRGSDMRGGSGVYGSSPVSRPGTRGNDMPRATSPAPLRSASPQPPRNDSSRGSYRSASPNPYAGSQRSPSQMSSPQKRGGDSYYRQASPASRSVSPAPFRESYNRPQSSYGGSDMAVQLAPAGDDAYGSQRSRGSRPGSRAAGAYDSDGSRQRSKSVADPSRLYTRDGRPILHYARALYMYQAAIPEELGFAKGDYLAVLRHQDDGWWEAEPNVTVWRPDTCRTEGMDTLQEAARVVTSKPVQRAVVNTALIVSTAVALLFSAAIASAVFFQNFLPHKVTTTPVHLQYGSGINPYGIASLTAPPMKSQQEYDISLTLSMPRSKSNVERGNFMINLHLLDSVADDMLQASAETYATQHEGFGDTKVLFRSRRPALLPYVDPLVSIASRILFLFYHIAVPKSSTDTMVIPLAERVWFQKDSGLPGSAYVEVEAGQSIQIYYATLQLTAQLRGLRWLMVHYRIPTYLTFTFLFWSCEILFMGLAWVVWINTAGSSRGTADGKNQKLEGTWRQAIKDEVDGDGEESRESTDRPETFPTYGRQLPLKYEPEVKREREEDQPLSELPREGAEADDEGEGEDDEDDEEDDARIRDSGIGTSYSESGAENIRRRFSRNSGD